MSPRFPCVNPVMESFFLDLLQVIISYWAESHLEPCQTSTMGLFCKINQRLQYVDYFPQKAPSQMFDWTPNVSPIEGALNVGCGWTASVRN